MQKPCLEALAAAALAALVLTACQRTPAEDAVGEWRQWRGLFGLGVSNETGLPVSWSPEGENVRWKTPLPESGNSSPIVTGGRVFLTAVYGQPEDDHHAAASRKELQRVVISLDLESGEILWQTTVFEGPTGKVHYQNTRAAPTPVSDGKLVYVYFDDQPDGARSRRPRRLGQDHRPRVLRVSTPTTGCRARRC